MSFVGPLGNPITVEEWTELCRAGGIGFVLAKSWVPTDDGDTIIQTCYFGTVFPESGVRPYGTAKSLSPHGVFTELEQYDDKATALAGHSRWALIVANPSPDPTPDR